MMDPFFIYLLKCGGILLLFFAAYRLLLGHETFFNYNRYFLLGGVVVSLLLPLLVFTKTVFIEQPEFIVYGDTAATAENNLSSLNPADWYAVFTFVYWAGVSFFFGRLVIQLLSLLRLISSSAITTEDGFKMVETRTDVTPFSFFNYIVYHPGSYNNKELQTIIAHEKIHVRQWHSVDILLAHLLSIFLWFIPFTWMYKKYISQNLEYIADNEAIQKVQSRKNYQYLLLHASVKAYKPAITNNFFNSLIKKRIVMLNKNRSQQRNVWRYGVILPFLMVFLLVFNVKTVAQVKVVKKVKNGNSEVVQLIQFSIDKNTTNEALRKLKKEIKGEKGDFSYKNLKRNEAGEITDITVEFRDNKGGYVTGNYNDDNGIKPIMFGHNEQGGVFINSSRYHGSGYSFSHSDQDVHIEGDSDESVYVVTKSGKGKGGKHKVHVKKMKHGDREIHIDENSDYAYVIVEKDGKDEKGEKSKKIRVKTTKHGDDDVDIDVEEYLNDDDVIVVEKSGKGKKGKKKKMHKIKIKHGDSDDDSVVVLRSSDGYGEEPLYIIDGKKASKEQLKEINPNNIERINVRKGESATEKYGKQGKDGVIEITTKKDD